MSSRVMSVRYDKKESSVSPCEVEFRFPASMTR